MYNYILYTGCIIVAGIGSLIVSKFGSKLGLMDEPNGRSSHGTPIPKGGGIGILAAFIFASLLLEEPLAFWLPTTVLALFSLLGDRLEISPKIRLPIQFIVAMLFVLFSVFNFELSAFLFIFFIVFIVATANWYNFMDGINGIAAITGIVGFGLIAFFNISIDGDSRFSILSICIALSCLGFLPFNMPNAKVFMGDVGSILLGFVFAAIVVMLSKGFLDFVCFAGFLFPFYADEFVTMAVRIKDNENLLKAHRRHFYQLLANEMGLEHWKVSVAYGILQLVVGVGVLLIRPFGILPVFALLLIFFSVFIWVNCFVRRKIEKRTPVK